MIDQPQEPSPGAGRAGGGRLYFRQLQAGRDFAVGDPFAT
jgi:hypothetical protein